MFWNRILPDSRMTLEESPSPLSRPTRRVRPQRPRPEEIKLDMQLALAEIAGERRREALRRKGVCLKAAAWALTYVSAMATIWAVLRLFG
jgi:hypothetical protein